MVIFGGRKCFFPPPLFTVKKKKQGALPPETRKRFTFFTDYGMIKQADGIMHKSEALLSKGDPLKKKEISYYVYV